uniref:(northern house mosquito) hypothetical protein n=1 Tax=Culex pipiens TaxID=7175 RepID=A0A8D8EX78_CULPI
MAESRRSAIWKCPKNTLPSNHHPSYPHRCPRSSSLSNPTQNCTASGTNPSNVDPPPDRSWAFEPPATVPRTPRSRSRATTARQRSSYLASARTTRPGYIPTG